MNIGAIRTQALPAAILVTATVLAWAMYAQAKGLTWQFDDLPNLAGLTHASTPGGLVNFVFGGVAGPTGRPLSLLTFLADYGAWPNQPWDFVRHSLVWHTMNTGLVFILFHQLLRHSQYPAKTSMLLAAGISAVWALLPIHASGILMPVQRMTLISAFFVLATLATYASLRARPRSAATALLLVTASAVGLVAATYSKENGALLLLFVPLIEWTFFEKLQPPIPAKAWKWALRLSFLAIPGYLAWHLYDAWEGIQTNLIHQRGYSLGEHLATQAVILWEYLRQIIIPRAAFLGPFHDDHTVHSWGQAAPWLAAFALLGAMLFLAFFARRFGQTGRFLAFGGTFYLAGHLLESSVIPIELYFEHRNYVASLGPVFIGAILVFKLFRRSKLQAGALGLLFCGLQLFSLQQTTSLWGNPLLAAEMWHHAHTTSARATQYLAWQYRLHDFDAASIRVLDEFSDKTPGYTVTRMQALSAACLLESPSALRARFQKMLGEVPKLRQPSSLTTSLAGLGRAIREGECEGISLQMHTRFLEALLGNQHVASLPKVRHHVRHELAQMADIQDEPEERLEHLKHAFHDFPSFSGAQLVAVLLFQAGKNAEAIEWIDHAAAVAPNRISGRSWQTSMTSLREAIVEVDAILQEASKSE